MLEGLHLQPSHVGSDNLSGGNIVLNRLSNLVALNGDELSALNFVLCSCCPVPLFELSNVVIDLQRTKYKAPLLRRMPVELHPLNGRGSGFESRWPSQNI